MARLPFDQTRLQTAQFNRVSPVNAPRVQPIDVTTEAAYAKNKALQDFGKGLFELGGAFLEVYAQEKRQEKKENLQNATFYLQEQGQDFLSSIEREPPKDFPDYANRESEFFYGQDSFGNPVLNQDGKPVEGVLSRIQKEFNLSEKEAKTLIRKINFEARVRAEGTVLRQESQTRQFEASQNIFQQLETFYQDFDPASYKSRTDLIEAINQFNETTLQQYTEGLQLSEQQNVIQSFNARLFSRKANALQQFEAHTLDKNRGSYAAEMQELLSRNLELDREIVVDQASGIIDKYQSLGVLDPDQAVKALVDIEHRVDRARADQLIYNDPVGFLNLFKDLKSGDKSPFPGLSRIELERYRQLANDQIQKQTAIEVNELRKNLNEGLRQYANPDTDQIQLDFNNTKLLNSLPEEVRPAFQAAMTYGQEMGDKIRNIGSKTLPELTAFLNTAAPKYYAADGSVNPAYEYQMMIYDEAQKITSARIKAIRADMGAVYFETNSNQDPLDASVIEANLVSQTQMLGLEGARINDLWRQGQVSPLPNQVYASILQNVDSVDSGVAKAEILKDLEARTGKYFPMVMEMMFRGKEQDGLGLAPYNYLYTEIENPAILENLFSAEKRGPENMKNLKNLTDLEKNAFYLKVTQNESVQDFWDSMSGTGMQTAALRESIQESVGLLALEYISRDNTLSLNDALDQAASQLIDQQYIFVEPGFAGGEGSPVRLPRLEFKDFENQEGLLQDALTDYVEEAIRKLPVELKETASDRQWSWRNTPNDDGLQLYVYDPETVRDQPVPGESSRLNYSQLKLLAAEAQAKQVPMLEQVSEVISKGYGSERVPDLGEAAAGATQTFIDSLPKLDLGGLFELPVLSSEDPQMMSQQISAGTLQSPERVASPAATRNPKPPQEIKQPAPAEKVPETVAQKTSKAVAAAASVETVTPNQLLEGVKVADVLPQDQKDSLNQRMQELRFMLTDLDPNDARVQNAFRMESELTGFLSEPLTANNLANERVQKYIQKMMHEIRSAIAKIQSENARAEEMRVFERSQ